MNDPNGLPGQEQSQSRRARRGGGGTSGFSAARGAAIIGVAVILGVVLLNAIDDGNSGPVGDGGSDTSSSTTTTTVAQGSSSTTTTTGAVSIPPASVSVLVLNGSGRAGVAGTVTNTLKAKGYRTLPPNNASSVRTGTVVYAKTGMTEACSTLATSISGAKVQPMPTPPPVTTDAACIVVVGV